MPAFLPGAAHTAQSDHAPHSNPTFRRRVAAGAPAVARNHAAACTRWRCSLLTADAQTGDGRRAEPRAQSALLRFRRMVFPVPDHRVAEWPKTAPGSDSASPSPGPPEPAGSAERPLHGIAKFRPHGFGVGLRAQLLKHPDAPEIMNQRPLFDSQVPAHHGQVIPLRLMPQKLPISASPVARGLGEQQNAGRETVDAMDNPDSLPLPLQLGGQQRQSGRSGGARDGTATSPAGLSITTTASSS